MYTEYNPSPLLSPYIDKYWQFKGRTEQGMRINILPDGCTDFIFTLGEVADTVGDSLVMQPHRSYFVGPMNRYSELVTRTDSVHMLGVRFLPCGLIPFMRLPLHELGNQRINTGELPSLFDDLFAEQLCEAPDLTARIKLVEKLLMKALYNHPQADAQIRYAVAYIDRHKGMIPIRTLADEICLCQRHFERKFKLSTGYTPKEYSRIIKFRNAIDLLKHATYDNLLTTAIEAGYYDAAHLSKEIRALSGNPPGSFLSLDMREEITLTYIES